MQYLPSFCGDGLVHVLERIRSPIAQDFVQAVQEDQMDHLPSTEKKYPKNKCDI